MVVHIFTLLLAPFASKLVNYSRHSESLNIRKNSEIDDIFLRRQRFVDFQTHYKDCLCLEWLTNLVVEGAKRSLKMWNTNFYESFSKSILLYMSSRLSKICSVHTFAIPRTVYFGWICMTKVVLRFTRLYTEATIFNQLKQYILQHCAILVTL